MKYCNTCGKNLPEVDFPWRNRSKATRGSRCKKCQKVYSNAHYRANKQLYIEKANRQREKVKQYLIEAKSHPCMDCGNRYHYKAMDFHHRNDDKVMGVADLVNFGMKRLKEEIVKCDLLCANCHRIRH